VPIACTWINIKRNNDGDAAGRSALWLGIDRFLELPPERVGKWLGVARCSRSLFVYACTDVAREMVVVLANLHYLQFGGLDTHEEKLLTKIII
jgi:hypothetical protein